MSTAEATDGTSPASAGPGESLDAASPPEDGVVPTRSRVPPGSPALAAGWLVRATAFSAIAAGVMGLIVAPGVRGNANEQVVVAIEHTAAALTYLTVELLVTVLLWGALEIARTRAVGILARVALIGGGAAVIAISAPGLRERLPPSYAVLVAAAATVAVIGGGSVAARAPHTRALAGVLFMLAFAALARLAAWELATAAGDRASVQLFGVSRSLATTGVLFEAAAQMIAVTWLGTRNRSAGQVGSTVALIAAFVITWGVARGMHAGPSLWQVVLRTALADAPGVPPPYGLDAVATFLVPASLLLALASAVQPKQVVVVVATMALALVSRGAFDAPLRAMCAVAASQWAALAWADECAMWRRSKS
jgi:hypothetical protein